jgi:phospholipase C
LERWNPRYSSVAAALTLALAIASWTLVPSPVASGSARAALAADAHVYPTAIRHVVVIMLENEELSDVYQYGPYEHYLVTHYGNASRFYAICHSAGAQGMALTSGRNFGCPTPIGMENTSNLGDVLDRYGLSWGGYMESMPTACDYGWAGTYDPSHNSFVHYTDIRYNPTRCDQRDVNSGAFNRSVAQGTLSAFSEYIPNVCDDGHTACGKNATTCGVWGSSFCHRVQTQQADRWLKGFLAPMLNHTVSTANGLDYNTAAERALLNTTAFLIVYDEGTSNSGYLNSSAPYNAACKSQTGKDLTACAGRVLMVAVSPVSAGTRFTSAATHYGVQSTAEWLLGVGNGVTSPDGGQDGTPPFPAMKALFG